MTDGPPIEPGLEPQPPRRSAGEWLFQLTTITVGVLIALSFDALLKWNGERQLVAQARQTLALEILDNRSELEAHIAAFPDRAAKMDAVLTLMDELDAGVEPTVSGVDIGAAFPSLSDAGWQTAERTGALALMDYAEVQELAEIYALQSLVQDNLRTAISAVTRAASAFSAAEDPYTLPPAARENVRARVLEMRASLLVDHQLGRQLLDAYANHTPKGDSR